MAIEVTASIADAADLYIFETRREALAQKELLTGKATNLVEVMQERGSARGSAGRPGSALSGAGGAPSAKAKSKAKAAGEKGF